MVWGTMASMPATAAKECEDDIMTRGGDECTDELDWCLVAPKGSSARIKGVYIIRVLQKDTDGHASKGTRHSRIRISE